MRRRVWVLVVLVWVRMCRLLRVRRLFRVRRWCRRFLVRRMCRWCRVFRRWFRR
ncbi:hypothetical protein [Micromonospora sp. CNB394]|uniref:hypothetical protein n=1 Tax=Micromonospora sp. CNB394 TaxID=1169151 RepID=UPI0012DFBD53|nr:hypothetical protein [Micromonospora sp. CNB394]